MGLFLQRKGHINKSYFGNNAIIISVTYKPGSRSNLKPAHEESDSLLESNMSDVPDPFTESKSISPVDAQLPDAKLPCLLDIDAHVDINPLLVA